MSPAQIVRDLLTQHGLGRAFYTVPSGEFIFIPFLSTEDFVRITTFEAALETLLPSRVIGQRHELGYIVKVMLK